MTGTVFSIEEFSVYDGPGIRTTVFLKGCPLRCSWCHNPEGQRRAPEIIRSPAGCIGCGNCEKSRREIDGKLSYTEESIKKCPRGLLRVCGEEYTPDALCQRLLKNAVILNRGGGVTFSGGEPLLQSDFVLECLNILRGKLHTAIQTCGYTSSEVFERVMNAADYFLYDLKLIDEGEHIRYTGVSNERILENFKTLAQSGKDFVVRVPLIPGVTDTEHNIEAIARLIAENNVSYAELLPYNKMAGGKYKMVSREYTPDFDESREVTPRIEIFTKHGIKIKIL